MAKKSAGAMPQGVGDEQSASAAVRQMFTAIAPRYDLLNHLLSCNIDRLWWRRTARMFAPILRREHACVLDVCCGTGDMTLALARARRGSQARIVGLDFSAAMLQRARAKSAARFPDVEWIEADALHAPLPDSSFDLVVSAFGFRNLANYESGLREMARLLKPGGALGILDFGRPRGIVGALYGIYFRHLLPAIGGMISGVREAYEYLPDSVARFPAPPEMLQLIERSGFREATWTPYSFGIAGLFRVTRK